MLPPTILSAALVVLWSAVGLCALSPCKNPQVRREWRAFSTDEKAEWIRAVKCLSTLPHNPALAPSVDPSDSVIPPVNASSSYYDDIVYMHMDLSTRVHFTGYFLPWHRWYVHVFERSLEHKCGYRGVSPYWNWTIDAPDFYESSFWDGSDPVSGLGGWGDPNSDWRVPDGAFSTMRVSYPSPHTVRRDYTYQPFDESNPLFPQPLLIGNASFSASVIKAILGTSAGDYKGFQTMLEAPEGPHGGVHVTVDGDLGGTCPENAPSNCVGGPKWSPNDPLFWMHHAMVDKIWYNWQQLDPRNANSFFGGASEPTDNLTIYDEYPNGGPPFLTVNSTMPADGMFPVLTIGDVLNTTGGVLCYVYE
ncbi:Di-copper centre-containing protein [Russula ochroleuca]|uniref:Di-copper centre-containing protein n=1 Tax=Russula ochroleuca TaxID=152965 RepID=A0A9P5MSK9_9AGAM|nr:Di-copper centre-containing protein [Russula ochroleuca]